jgi:hypothetical protein
VEKDLNIKGILIERLSILDSFFMNSMIIPWDVIDMQDLENYYYSEEICDNPAEQLAGREPAECFWRGGLPVSRLKRSEFLRTLENLRQTGFLRICLQSETSLMDVLLFIQ